MKHALVTGASGFIGSNLVERLLAEGYNVRAFVHYNSMQSNGWLDYIPKHNNLEIFAGDIVDEKCVDLACEGVDIVFHLSSLIGIPYSYVAPKSYINTNIIGAYNVLEAVTKRDIPMIHTSTSEVYGSALFVPMTENHPLHPQSPYSASKASADLLAMSYHYSFGSKVNIIRPYNTFGPKQSCRGAIPTIIKQYLESGEHLHPIIRVGSTWPTRDFLYVKDTVEAFMAMSKLDSCGHTIHFGTNIETSILDLIKIIGKIIGAKEPIIKTEMDRLRPEKSEVKTLKCGYFEAKRLLGWEPKYTLEDGLRETIEWYRKNLHLFKTMGYVI